jgi:hypothetical protein
VRLHQLARLVGSALGLAAAVLLLAGLWTYTFDVTDGTLLKNEHRRIRPVGEYPTAKGSRLRRIPVEHIEACYRYHVGDSDLESCRIGAGVSHLTLSPLREESWERLRKGERVRVFYSSGRPAIAVLHRGPDWIMVLGLGGLAPFFFVAARKLAALDIPPDRAFRRRHALRMRPKRWL